MNVLLFQAFDIGGADDDDEDNDACERMDFNLTSAGDFSQAQASVSSEGTMAEQSAIGDFMGDNLVAPPRKVRLFFKKNFIW